MPRYLKTGISDDTKADADAKVRRIVEDILGRSRHAATPRYASTPGGSMAGRRTNSA